MDARLFDFLRAGLGYFSCVRRGAFVAALRHSPIAVSDNQPFFLGSPHARKIAGHDHACRRKRNRSSAMGYKQGAYE